MKNNLLLKANRVSSIFTYVNILTVFLSMYLSVAAANTTCDVAIPKDLNAELQFFIQDQIADRNMSLSQIETLSVDSSDQDFQFIINQHEFILTLDDENPKVYFSSKEHESVNQSSKSYPLVINFKSMAEFQERFNCSDLRASKNMFLFQRRGAISAFKYLSTGQSEMSLGETIIRMEHIYLYQKYGKTFNFNEVIAKYNSILAKVTQAQRLNSTPDRFFTFWKEILEIIYNDDQENIDYCGPKTLLSDALISKCTNCIGETSLFLSIMVDAEIQFPKNWVLSVELFRNHVRPVLYDENQEKVFDLTYGSPSDKKAAIAPWKEFVFMTLRGYDTAFFAYEKDFLERYKPQYLFKPTICISGFDLGYATRDQLVYFGDMSSCKSFSGSAPDHADNSGRVANYGDTKSKDPGLLSKAGGILSSIGGGIAQLIVKKKESFVPEYSNIKDQLNPSDLKIVEDFESNNINHKKFADHFSKAPILDFLGIYPHSNQASNLIFEDLKKSSDCRILPPIKLSHKPSSLGISLDNIDPYGISLVIGDEETYLKILSLSMVERYKFVISYFNNEIIKSAQKIEIMFSGSVKQALLMQSADPRALERFRYSSLMYYYIVKNTLAYCNSGRQKLNDVVITNSVIPSLKTYFNPLIEFKKIISENPSVVIDALTEIENNSPGIELNFIDVSGNLMSMKEVLDYIDKDLHKPFSRLFSDVIDYLLFNPNYFFTGPESEEDITFGKVRPFVPVLFKDLNASLRGPKNYVELLPKINLPKVNAAPCRPDEKGYVMRGVLVINCGEGQGGLSELEKTQFNDTTAKDLKNFKGNSLHEQAGLDQTTRRNSVQLPDNVNLENLQPSLLTDQVLMNGSPDAQKNLVIVNTDIDPRQEVIIEPKYWKNILHMISTYRPDETAVAVAVHHLQRKSIEDVVANAFPPYLIGGDLVVGSARIDHISKRSTFFEMGDEDRLKAILVSIDDAILHAKKEIARGIPLEFDDNSYKAVAYREIINGLKPNWSFKKYISRYDIEYPMSSDLTHNLYRYFDQDQFASDALVACYDGDRDNLKCPLEYFEKYREWWIERYSERAK